jgi:hypothetical protein
MLVVRPLFVTAIFGKIAYMYQKLIICEILLQRPTNTSPDHHQAPTKNFKKTKTKQFFWNFCSFLILLIITQNDSDFRQVFLGSHTYYRSITCLNNFFRSTGYSIDEIGIGAVLLWWWPKNQRSGGPALLNGQSIAGEILSSLRHDAHVTESGDVVHGCQPPWPLGFRYII